MRTAIADNGSDVDGWFVALVLGVAFVVWLGFQIRQIRRDRNAFPRPTVPVVRPIDVDEIPCRPRFCSYIGCPDEPVVSVNGWLVCATHRPRTAYTTKEIPA